mmetsp:Transcript_39770/g.109485  ORF Transcript_39770/g.109485 Transcript_39770/m.109485 type:complete len:230 (+) Transcript_39770:441-1130(+)
MPHDNLRRVVELVIAPLPCNHRGCHPHDLLLIVLRQSRTSCSNVVAPVREHATLRIWAPGRHVVLAQPSLVAAPQRLRLPHDIPVGTSKLLCECALLFFRMSKGTAGAARAVAPLPQNADILLSVCEFLCECALFFLRVWKRAPGATRAVAPLPQDTRLRLLAGLALGLPARRIQRKPRVCFCSIHDHLQLRSLLLLLHESRLLCLQYSLRTRREVLPLSDLLHQLHFF